MEVDRLSAGFGVDQESHHLRVGRLVCVDRMFGPVGVIYVCIVSRAEWVHYAFRVVCVCV